MTRTFLSNIHCIVSVEGFNFIMLMRACSWKKKVPAFSS